MANIQTEFYTYGAPDFKLNKDWQNKQNNYSKLNLFTYFCMETGSNINHANEDLHKIKDEILSYISYCRENKLLEKEWKIFHLRNQYIIFFWPESTRNDDLIKKIYNFQERLKYYSNKKEKNWFNKAFDEIFYKERQTYTQFNYSNIRSLIWYLLNRHNNGWFSIYKNSLNQQNQEQSVLIDPKNSDWKNKVKDTINDELKTNLIDDSDIYTEYAYDERILIWEESLEKIYLEIIDAGKSKSEAITKAIKAFKKEEERNYSEWELDTIASLFHNKIKH